MKRSTKRLISVGLGIASLAAGFAATLGSVDGAVRYQALKSNDLTGIRKEALTLFPRGTRLQEAESRLTDIGFVCEPMRRSLGDVSGPALLCASNGRGYPDYPAINVTVSTRNGLVSEIEVWNIMARSDDELALDHLASDEPTRMVMSAAADPTQ